MTARRWALLALAVVLASMAYVSRRSGSDADEQLALAMAEARAGRIDSSVAILDALQGDALPDPAREALRVRLIAAQGNVRNALIELVKGAEQIAEVESLTSVLGTLHESLERASIDPRAAPPPVVQYSLGFGASRDAIAELPEAERVVLDALHTFETGQPVDAAALERLTVDSNELPRFIRLVKVRGTHTPDAH